MVALCSYTSFSAVRVVSAYLRIARRATRVVLVSRVVRVSHDVHVSRDLHVMCIVHVSRDLHVICIVHVSRFQICGDSCTIRMTWGMKI